MVCEMVRGMEFNTQNVRNTVCYSIWRHVILGKKEKQFHGIYWRNVWEMESGMYLPD